MFCSCQRDQKLAQTIWPFPRPARPFCGYGIGPIVSLTLISKGLFGFTSSENNPARSPARGKGGLETGAFCSEAKENARRHISKKHETLKYHHSMHQTQPNSLKSMCK